MALDTSQLTPEPEQRDRLVGAMAKLIRQRGWERFVTGLFVEPTSAFFPDKTSADVGGVRLLIFRLMVYAGLGELNPTLALHDTSRPDAPLPRALGGHHGEDHSTTAGWFAGIEGGDCLFGLDIQQTLDVDGLIGVLCHEVCHAYRHHFELEVPTREIEEELTDLTTIYLGFGILSANSSYRYRTGGSIDGYMATSYWSEHQTGYLPPHAMCFLLAVQAVAMGFDTTELARIKGHLDTTQRAMFSASYKLLASDVDGLRDKLGIVNDESLWPAPADPSDGQFADVIRDFRPRAGDNQSVLVGSEPRDTSHPSFRVVGTRAARGVVIAFAVGMSLFALRVVSGAAGFAVLVALTWLGWWIGRSAKHYTCASPDCKAAASATAPSCPGCHRTFAGNIASPNDRLAAEEELLQKDDVDRTG